MSALTGFQLPILAISAILAISRLCSFVSFVVTHLVFPIPAMTGVPGKPAFGFQGWDDVRCRRFRRSASPHPAFLLFCCKQRRFLKSTLGWPLRDAWVALGWPK